ncbi:unnamed protein product [Ectocarpus sp. 4 AP-2014]
MQQVYSAQYRYGLLSPGSCSEDGSMRCEQWVLQISDHNTLEAEPERPEVFFSGCLHGDEQVGPTAVVEMAKLMVFAAVCHVDSTAKECDDEALRDAPESVPWLARLALTRSTVIMPMANSIGYYNTDRWEHGMDPNRDFPYGQVPQNCMTTITARQVLSASIDLSVRSVNEVWREHAFQLAVTFHGGMVGMAYEWGSPDHPHRQDRKGNWLDVSPDHEAQKELTAGLSRFAGGFKEHGRTFKPYPTGRMNELVYPVAGGMEDWAYAGSWGKGKGVCDPGVNGQYPKEKTIYSSAMLRALNILVEASNFKHPPQALLGSRQGLLGHTPSEEEHGNGHVARNVRLALMAVDLVEPYVQWGPFDVETEENGGTKVVVTDEKHGVDMEWTVGGSFEVDATQLVWGPWPKEAASFTGKDWEELAAAADSESRSPEQTGHSRWTNAQGLDEEEATVFRTRFELGTALPTLPEDDGIPAAFVVAVATVDQAWAEQSVQGFPDVGPQSHYVNARTSEDWLEENNGHIVRGRLRWLSTPLKVAASLPPNSEAPVVPPNTTAPAVNETSGEGEAAERGEEGYREGTIPPTERAMPWGGSGSHRVKRRGPVVASTAAPVLLGGLALIVLLIGGLAMRRATREGGFCRCEGRDARSTRRLRGRGGKGSAQGPGESIESGGPGAREQPPSNSSRNPSSDSVSRRRSGDASFIQVVGVGGSGTLSRPESMEMRGLLSGTGDTP